jgi:hypothetical protein
MNSPDVAPTPAPDQVLNPKDPGDETRRRNRYQDVRAACYILALFDDTEGVIEIICEQQEDILVKYDHGKFRGIQIKTKEDGTVPFKAVDEEVVKSLQRFIAEERDFPDQFDQFVLGCNCGFWEEKKNGSNLKHLLEEAKDKTLADAPKKVKDYLKRLVPAPAVAKPPRPKKAKPSRNGDSAPITTPVDANPDCSGPQETHEQMLDRALKVLQKVVAEAMAPLAGMVELLVAGLAKLDFVGKNQTYDDLSSIADALIAEVFKASSKEHASFKKHYFELCKDTEKAKTDSIIDGKRFTRLRAEEVIRKAFPAKTPLTNGTEFAADRLPAGTRTQQAKMTAGGIVIDDIEEAVQQRQAAEYVLSTWINKFGVSKANAQYQDLRSAVLTEANEAKKQASEASSGSLYGSVMLTLVKDRLRQLHSDNKHALHGVRFDQLLGIAGIMTEECPLWWSQRFNLQLESES